MGCNGCGTSSCRGCKDIKIELPEGVGIESITDNGDGTWTITYTDATTQIINTPGTVPNDSWVEFDENTNVAVGPVPTSGAINTITLDGAYKIMNEDTVYIRCSASINATITARPDSINFNFKLGPLTSNWYAGTKLPTMVVSGGTFQNWVPVSIVCTTGGASVPNGVGRAYAAHTPAPNGLIALGNTNLQMPNGTYDFVVDFEMTCKLV